MDRCIKHKRKCHNMGKWKHLANLPFKKGLNKLNITCSIIFWRWTEQQTICWLTQFLSTVRLGKEMKIKSRLLPFSVICIQGQCTFCFVFLNSLPPLSKCCYTPTRPRPFGVVWNPLSGIVSFVDWPENVNDQFGKVCTFWSVSYRDWFFFTIWVC